MDGIFGRYNWTRSLHFERFIPQRRDKDTNIGLICSLRVMSDPICVHVSIIFNQPVPPDDICVLSKDYLGNDYEAISRQIENDIERARAWFLRPDYSSNPPIRRFE